MPHRRVRWTDQFRRAFLLLLFQPRRRFFRQCAIIFGAVLLFARLFAVTLRGLDVLQQLVHVLNNECP